MGTGTTPEPLRLPLASRFEDMLPAPGTFGWMGTGDTAAAAMPGHRDTGRARHAPGAHGNRDTGKTGADGITIAMAVGADTLPSAQELGRRDRLAQVPLRVLGNMHQ